MGVEVENGCGGGNGGEVWNVCGGLECVLRFGMCVEVENVCGG